MLAILVLAVLMAAGLLWLLRGSGGSDAPARIVTVAAGLLPEHRRDWGRAMAAELAQIHGHGRRWRFAVGAVRVALFPPPRLRNRVLAVALAGLAAAAGATVAAASEVPGLSVFAAVLGLLLCGYATAVTSRSPRPRPTMPRVIVGVTAMAGAAAAVAVVAQIAAAHPAATTDDTHVFSILFALILSGYLALGLTPPRLGGHPDTVLWWALAATLASAAGWAAAVLATPAATVGVIGYLSPAGVAAALAASAGASAVTRSRAAGARAGLLAVVLGAPVHFAVTLTAILHVRHYTLTTPYDLAAYPHSGYPDVASYLLSDALGGNIIGLVLYPIPLLALALLGAAAGTGLRRLATGRTAPPAA
ncbi:MAG TPA: hypothetical protein VF256_22680 [Streptosporangiaceae bacterium]